jgi:hypothetical protein
MGVRGGSGDCQGINFGAGLHDEAVFLGRGEQKHYVLSISRY